MSQTSHITAEKCAALNKQVQKIRQNILTLEDRVQKKSKQLKKDKEDHTKDCLKKQRNETHRLDTENDKLNRPSDQARMIRNYGKMDMDLWTRNEVRYWFNKNAPDPKELEYNWSPVDSGYCVRSQSANNNSR
mmetsp:Transcript_35543/g.36220  ORF Transcript_35543/g.36220 Transcript_35543/m.36220 type:complete len:133 (+) Transcript_35543:240-638(+)